MSTVAQLSGDTATQPAKPDRIVLIARACFLVAVFLAMIVAAIHFRTNWMADSGADAPAGILIALAWDLKHGIFYRPLLGPLGYGGTRYFPLYFVLHALLMKLGVPVLLSAYLLSGAAMFALILGVFVLLKRTGAERWLAAACAAALLTSVAAQYAVVSPHADGLASALNIWGLLLIVAPPQRSRGVLLGAILFTLAWSTKLTTCFGLAVAVVWLIATGQRRRASQLALGTGFGYLLVAGIMFAASGGRVFQILKACSSGGISWERLLNVPTVILWNAAHRDLNVLLLIVFALTMLLAHIVESPSHFLRDWPALFFVAVALTTIFIFASPGTNLNHFLDIQVAALLLLGCLASQPQLLQRRLALCALALATVIPAVRNAAALPSTQSDRTALAHNGSPFARIAASIGNTEKPVLAENPLIPILMGHTLYVTDSWMLRLLRERIPGFGDAFLHHLSNGEFGAVVLAEDPETPWGQNWYSTQGYGPGFTAALTENYRLHAVIGQQYIYLPITSPRLSAKKR